MPAKLSEAEIQRRLAKLPGVRITARERRPYGKFTRLIFDLECQCGNKWSDQTFLNRTGCWECYQDKLRFSEAKIQEQIEALRIRWITVLRREYQRKNGLCYDVRCRCGHEWTMRASRLEDGCWMCEHRTPESEIQEQISNLATRNIEVISREYSDAFGSICLCFHVKCQCGYAWFQTANHLKRKGCRECQKVNLRTSETDLENQIADLLERHITVLNKEYREGVLVFDVQCQCGHAWSRRAKDLKIYGCIKCAEFGFKTEKAAIVYYVKFGNLYKIGITNHTVRKRFTTEGRQPEIIEVWHFEKGEDAYEFEQRVIRENAFDLYHGPQILRHTGNDEFFVCDVLGLDGAERVQTELQFAA